MLDYLRDFDFSGLGITGWINLLIWVGLLLAKVFAFVDALRWKQAHYTSAGKLNKTIWLVITGLSLAFHLIDSNVIGIVNLAGTIASIVYLVDVRPALQQVAGRGGRSSSGPYGPW